MHKSKQLDPIFTEQKTSSNSPETTILYFVISVLKAEVKHIDWKQQFS